SEHPSLYAGASMGILSVKELFAFYLIGRIDQPNNDQLVFRRPLRRNRTWQMRTNQDEAEDRRISVFEFGPGTLLLESRFRHRSRAGRLSKTAGSTYLRQSPTATPEEGAGRSP
ncbi:MAG TPA: hypothetical protein VKP69_25680, partial [Isosphaeraceae bacterium]|nr:hypothetical protein [Isosphaeraceae bacterium]